MAPHAILHFRSQPPPASTVAATIAAQAELAIKLRLCPVLASVPASSFVHSRS